MNLDDCLDHKALLCCGTGTVTFCRNLSTDLSGTGPVINYGSGTGTVIKFNHKSSHSHRMKLCI
jgi:hypothetical protein